MSLVGGISVSCFLTNPYNRKEECIVLAPPRVSPTSQVGMTSPKSLLIFRSFPSSSLALSRRTRRSP
jgi:hypothetical protein